MKKVKFRFFLLMIVSLAGITILQGCKASKKDRKLPQDKPQIACLVIYRVPDDPVDQHWIRVFFEESLPEGALGASGSLSKFKSDCSVPEPKITNEPTVTLDPTLVCPLLFSGKMDLAYAGDEELQAGGCYVVDFNLTIRLEGRQEEHVYEKQLVEVVDQGSETCADCP